MAGYAEFELKMGDGDAATSASAPKM